MYEKENRQSLKKMLPEQAASLLQREQIFNAWLKSPHLVIPAEEPEMRSIL